MLVADSGTWPDIIETRGEGLELGIEEDWNMDKSGEEREILNNQTI